MQHSPYELAVPALGPVCGVFDKGFEKEIVLLCFYANFDEEGNSNAIRCQTFDGKYSEELEIESKYDHSDSSRKLGNYNGWALTVGGKGGPHTEKLTTNDQVGLKWASNKDFPAEQLRFTDLISTKDRVIVIGGAVTHKNEEGEEYKVYDQVYEYYEREWNFVGTLNAGRQGHHAIQSSEHEIMIIGGYDGYEIDESYSTEIWNIQYKNSTQRKPLLSLYITPLIYKVKGDFCSAH